MKIKDVAIRKINGGYIVSHYVIESKDTDDGPCCRPAIREEHFFTDEKEAGDKVAELAKDMEKGGY